MKRTLILIDRWDRGGLTVTMYSARGHSKHSVWRREISAFIPAHHFYLY